MRLEIEIECQVMRHILTALRVIYVDVRWYKRNIDCDIFLGLLKESIYLLQFKMKQNKLFADFSFACCQQKRMKKITYLTNNKI